MIDAPYDAASRVAEFNPLGKIPVLVLDDSTTIFDSRVIVEYLDNASPVTKLLPEDTRHRIQTRRFSDIAVGCCLGFVDLRLPGLNWREVYPSLAKLSEKLALRPSFRDTVPPSA